MSPIRIRSFELGELSHLSLELGQRKLSSLDLSEGNQHLSCGGKLSTASPQGGVLRSELDHCGLLGSRPKGVSLQLALSELSKYRITTQLPDSSFLHFWTDLVTRAPWENRLKALHVKTSGPCKENEVRLSTRRGTWSSESS